MAIKWPKMMKIDILLVGHPITQPTGQDQFISFCKINKNSDPPPLSTLCHALLTETKQHLAAALGRAEGYRWDQISESDLRLKIAISEELLQLCNILEPGLSKCRGITLLDLAEARGRLLHKTKSGSGLLEGLLQVEKEAEEADTILKLEDEASIEGNVAKMAREQIAQVRMAVRALKSQIPQR